MSRILFLNGSNSTCYKVYYLWVQVSYLSFSQMIPSICPYANGIHRSYAFPSLKPINMVFPTFVHSWPNCTLDCQYYGYVNGDDSPFSYSPGVLKLLQQNKNVSQKRLIVGRRTNYPWMNITQLPIKNGEYESLLHSICSSDAPYMSNAVVNSFGTSQD